MLTQSCWYCCTLPVSVLIDRLVCSVPFIVLLLPEYVLYSPIALNLVTGQSRGCCSCFCLSPTRYGVDGWMLGTSIWFCCRCITYGYWSWHFVTHCLLVPIEDGTNVHGTPTIITNFNVVQMGAHYAPHWQCSCIVPLYPNIKFSIQAHLTSCKIFCINNRYIPCTYSRMSLK